MTLDLGITDVLPTIRIPTLVMSKPIVRQDTQEVAEAIPAAGHVEIPGEGLNIIENDFAVEAIEDFLGGVSPQRIPDSVLATLLFTDLVGSTERAAELGDRGWRELLAEQRSLARRELEALSRLRGRHAGDGLFARFDGPARAIACARAVVARTQALGWSCEPESTRATRGEHELKGVPGTWPIYAVSDG